MKKKFHGCSHLAWLVVVKRVKALLYSCEGEIQKSTTGTKSHLKKSLKNKVRYKSLESVDWTAAKYNLDSDLCKDRDILI